MSPLQEGYTGEVFRFKALFSLPAIGAETPVLFFCLVIGDAVIHAGYIWWEKRVSEHLGLSLEPVVTDEDRWSIFGIGTAGDFFLIVPAGYFI